ncbi:MFS transporter [uncultured Thermanaerothrix sp.]|uniref:MFS transporter n=1 Tax=uncultured Thermanaerothrix sp. TaxID=1195149 RepID=UPI00260DDE1E|nr:MFS transporter [uncultured Thermanaerothrix sp.]
MSSPTRALGRFDTIIHASLGLAAGLSAAFFAVLATRLGASPWLLALITSAPYLANLLAPFWVAQARRWGTHRLMVGSLAAAGIILLALGLARTPLVFALLVLLYYLFYGIGDPLYVALAEIVYPERTGSSLGRVQAVFNGVHALANALAGWLIDTFGAFITLAVASVSTSVAAVTYLPFPDLSNGVKEGTASPWQILRQDSLIRRMVLTLMIAGTGMVMMLPAFPLVEVQQLGLNNTQIGILLATNSLALVVASWLWGQRLSKTPTHIVNAFRLGMLAIVGMAALYAMSGSFWELLIANILCGIGGSAISVGWRLFAIDYPYGTDDLSGLHLLTCGIRGLYAPALGAVLISMWNPAIAFWVAAALVLVGILILPPTDMIAKLATS